MILLYCQILHKKPYILQAIDIVNYTTASVLDKPDKFKSYVSSERSLRRLME